MALGKDGFVWIVETNPGAGQDRVTRWDPNVPAQIGASYLIGNALADPSSVAVGADGALWVAETGANGSTVAATIGGLTNLFGPRGMALGPDNNIWISGFGANKIGKRRVRRYICVGWKITTSH